MTEAPQSGSTGGVGGRETSLSAPPRALLQLHAVADTARRPQPTRTSSVGAKTVSLRSLLEKVLSSPRVASVLDIRLKRGWLRALIKSVYSAGFCAAAAGPARSAGGGRNHISDDV